MVQISASVRMLGFLVALLTTTSAHAISFENVTQSAGVGGNVGESYGASWGDFNGDGYPDLFSDNHRDFGRLWRNNGDGTFADVSAVADGSAAFGFETKVGKDTHGSAWADLNGDGLQDLVTTVETKNGHYLISNGSTLTEQGPAMGLVLGHDNGSRGAVAFDSNNNGLLDLKIVGTRETASNLFRQGTPGSYSLAPGSGGATCPNGTQWVQFIDLDASGTLEMACGDGSRFPRNVVDFSSGQGQPFSFAATSRSRDGVVGDFNNDQRQDLLHVLGSFRINELTQVSSTAVEATGNITAGVGTRTIRLTTAGDLSVDLDADNWNFVINRGGTTQDLYIGADGVHPASLDLALAPSGSSLGIAPTNGRAGMFIGYLDGEWRLRISNTSGFNVGYFQISSSEPITSASIDTVPGDAAFVPRLQLNTESGFVDATAGSGLTAERCISGAAADFDNDMDLDVFLGCRGGSSNIENVVFENQGDGTFVKVTNHGGEGVTGASLADQAGQTESVVVADYDADGFVDVFVTNGLNLFPLRAGGPTELFRNSGNSNHWIELDLKGTASNIDGVGAIVRVTAGGVTQYREQNGGYHRWAQNHSRIHVGLAGYSTADVTIEWPSGQVDSYPGVAANTLYLATEGEALAPRFGAVPVDNSALFCGNPNVNGITDRGTFIWRDCGGSDRWTLEVSGGSTPGRIDYRGVLDGPISGAGVTAQGLEAADTLTTFAVGPIDYDLIVYDRGVDTFSFDQAASICFRPGTPAGLPIWLGATRTVLTDPAVDLSTGLPCAESPADRDGDGLSDDDESSIHGTDPDLADTDGGGIDDGPEVANGTDPLDAGDDLALDCGPPQFDPATEAGYFLWRDCAASGPVTWQLAVTGAGPFKRYRGDLTASVPLSAVAIDLESSDLLDTTPGDGVLDFELGVLGNGTDQFIVSVPAGATACFTAASGGFPVYVGPNRLQPSSPFDLASLGACVQATPIADLECGEPSIDAASDAGFFLWRDCSAAGPDRQWRGLVAAGGGDFIEYLGVLTSTAPLVATGSRLEGTDVVDSAPGDGVVDLILGVSQTGIDEFAISTPGTTGTCLALNLPAGVGAFLGATRAPLATPFDLLSIGACAGN